MIDRNCETQVDTMHTMIQNRTGKVPMACGHPNHTAGAIWILLSGESELAERKRSREANEQTTGCGSLDFLWHPPVVGFRERLANARFDFFT
jgi:hypothetical protein